MRKFRPHNLEYGVAVPFSATQTLRGADAAVTARNLWALSTMFYFELAIISGDTQVQGRLAMESGDLDWHIETQDGRIGIPPNPDTRHQPYDPGEIAVWIDGGYSFHDYMWIQRIAIAGPPEADTFRLVVNWPSANLNVKHIEFESEPIRKAMRASARQSISRTHGHIE